MSGDGKDGDDGNHTTRPEGISRPGTVLGLESGDSSSPESMLGNTLTRSDPEVSGTSLDLATSGERDRYQIRGELGKGGQSVVRRAWDVRLEREVAIKELRSESSEATRDRFWREARITARLEHPNIVPVYEIGRRDDGTLYCVQKLVRSDGKDGTTRTLRAALESARSLDQRLRLLPQFLAVCQGIAYAHAQGILHRDIKPENVVLGQFGETVILDWGLARVMGDQARPTLPTEGVGAITIAGLAYGTPAYMSPEQARGETVKIDERSDVWSLGVLLFELLTGRTPFVGRSGIDVVEQVRNARVPHAREVEPYAPPELAAVARRAMERDPAARYPSAIALADEIVAWQSGRTVSVYRYSLREKISLWLLHNKTVASSGLAVLLAVLVSGVVIWSRYLAARSATSHALLEKARTADRQLRWNEAALYYAQARVYDDNPETQWGVRTRANRHVPPPRTLGDNTEGVKALAWSPDGKLLASAGVKGHVRISSLDGTESKSPVTHGSDALAVAWSKDGAQLLSGGRDGKAILWFGRGFEQSVEVSNGHGPVNDVAFSADGAWVVMAYETGEVELASLPNFATRRRFNPAEPSGVKHPIYGLAVDPLGGRIAIATWSGLLEVRTLEGKLLQALTRVAPVLLDVKYSPDGKSLAVAGNDRVVRWYDLDADGLINANTVRLLEGHESKVYALSFSNDSNVLASAGTDQTMRLWRRESGRGSPLVGRSLGGLGELEAVALAPDGKSVAVGGQTQAAAIYAVPVDDSMANILDLRIEGLQSAPGLDWYGHCDSSGLRIFRTGQAEPLVRALNHRCTTREIAVARGGSMVAWPCIVHSVCVGDGPELSQIRKVPYPYTEASKAMGAGHVRAVGVAHDGAWLAASDRSGEMRLWSLPDLTFKHLMRGHTEAVYSIDASPDGTLIATGSYDHTVRLWNPQSGALVKVLESPRSHTQGVRRVRFSPDGKLLATAGWDRTVKLWDVASHSYLRTCQGHEDHVFGLDWAPDGSWLASGARDGTVRIWDPATCRSLATIVTDEAEVFGLAVWGDGRGFTYAGTQMHSFTFQPLSSPTDQRNAVEKSTGLVLNEATLTVEKKLAP